MMAAPCVDEAAVEESPEELALRAKGGDETAVLPLWESVRGFVMQKAFRAYQRARGFAYDRGTSCAAEQDDLVQAGFLAVLQAAETYDDTRAAGFLTYLDYFLRSAFAETLGYGGDGHDALIGAASLDVPLSSSDGDESDTTRLDTVSDESALCEYQEVEDGVYIVQLHDALDAEIDRLPPRRAEAMRLFYWAGETQKAIAERQCVSAQNVSAEIKRGVETMRRGNSARRLQEFLEDGVNVYEGNGLASFRRRGSGVESAVLRREELAVQWRGKQNGSRSAS